MSYLARKASIYAAASMLLVAPIVSSQPALALFRQQGQKLVGSLSAAFAQQGWSVAVSADGNTAIVGGIGDNSDTGAAWIFIRGSNGVWKQQGQKLVDTTTGIDAKQGTSVALSADGNTAIVGGPDAGAAWVYARSNGVWTRQGKLTGAGAVGSAFQGNSVALSANGDMAIVGGPGDNSGAGAAWLFIRRNGVWKQLGSKLTGAAVVGSAGLGASVALSADGNTAIAGGPGDNSGAGAAWVFARGSGIWSQQGNKLVGTGAVGGANQGNSVALSADGNTAIVGGPGDNSWAGAAWIFTRGTEAWSQQGNELTGTGVVGAARLGNAVSLSSDGNTAVIGGPDNNSQSGAVWVFTRSKGVWSQQGHKLIGTGAVGPYAASQGSSVALSGDGNTAIIGGIGDNSDTGAAWVFVAAPTVTGISPIKGPAEGGTNVIISGTNFTDATAVKFGATAAASFTVKSATRIVARTPKHPAGAVTVTVSTSAGTGRAKGFTFFGASPTITNVSPITGPAAGGTSVTINGTNFNGATAVKFGTTAAASFTVKNATAILARTPKHAAGSVNLTVITPEGVVRRLDAFTFK